MAVLRWVIAPLRQLTCNSFQTLSYCEMLGFFFHHYIIQIRQLAVSGCGQPFRSQATPSEAHCRWVFPHGRRGHSHWTHALLHGTVHHTQILSFKSVI